MVMDTKFKIEWQTFALIIGCYLIWFALVIYGDALPQLVWIMLMGVLITLFMSVTHEVIHCHPTHSLLINRILLLMPIGWCVSYERFSDTHLAHHKTAELTDPFDDPESWYLDENSWSNQSKAMQKLLKFNNTLFGRMLVGPVISMVYFYMSEFKLMFSKDEKVSSYMKKVYLFHLVLCLAFFTMFALIGSVPVWLYLPATYFGFSLLLIRTFLEHQAKEDLGERTVIIERCDPIAFLFLFNNLHFVHHHKPNAPWYELPKLYKQNREQFIKANKGYVYASYGEIFKRYFFRMKEPIKFPLTKP